MSHECERFGRYLIGVRPGEYVRAKYVAALERFPARFAPSSRVDRILLSLASGRAVPVRAADMAARFIAPASALRRRLVLLTALLENAPETYERYEAPDAGPFAFFVGLAGRGAVSAVALLFGLFATAAGLALGMGRAR